MQQTDPKGIQEYTWMVWKFDPLGIVQETKIWPCWQMVYTEICYSLKITDNTFLVFLFTYLEYFEKKSKVKQIN